MQPDLGGRTALVTGGGRGIGRATALALARRGAATVVTARSRHEIEAVVQEIRREGGEARAIPGDIARDHDILRLFDESGPVDILINNAGIVSPVAPAASADPKEWQRNIVINLNAVFLTVHHALPGMMQRGWGRIVNVSSGSARGTVIGWSAYSAAKAGVEAFTRVVAREIAGENIRINAVRPGIVDTGIQAELRAASEEDFTRENVERYRSYKERGMLRDPADPARLILWLLSPEAEELNGEVLAIDDPEIAARIGLQPIAR